MSPIGDTNFCSTAAGHKPVWRSLALQNVKAASDLNGNRDEGSASRQEFHQRRDTLPVACSGTEDAVPFRYEPRLVSSFVAQLLGQVLPNPERPALEARAAYASEDSRASLLLDTRL